MKKIISIFLILIFCVKFIYGQDLKSCRNGDINFVKTNPSCSSNSDGKITITDSNLDLLTFQLFNLTEGKIIRDFTSDKDFSYLKQATYRLIAKDSLNSFCYSDIQIISPPSLLLIKDNITATKPNKNKADGSLTISFSGGTPPYILSINRTDNKFSQSIPLGNSTSTIANGLLSGIYSISVLDSKSCKSVGVQFELSNKDNFNFSITQSPKKCDSLGLFKIILSNGQPPYEIQVKLDNQIFFSNTAFQQSEYKVDLTAFGKYELLVQDKRKIPETIEYNYQDIDCHLNVSTQVIERPNINNQTNGKIQISIIDGKPPFNIKCINQLTNEVSTEQILNLNNFIFSNLKESNYSVAIIDKDGRKFDTTFSINITYPTNQEAQSDYQDIKNKLIDDLAKYECNIKHIEDVQKTIRITLSIVGLGGTIASAGIGTLVGGIITGVVTTGGMLTNEFASDKKLEDLKTNFRILKNIETIYTDFSETKFLKANWTSGMYKEYEIMKQKVLDLRKGLVISITPKCKQSKLEKYKANQFN